MSEPLGSQTWFPSNNTPRDKATYGVRVDAPSRYAVAGNGDLAGRRRHDTRTTWHWVQRRQQATYLTMISIGRYHVFHSTMRTTTGRALPVWSFVAPRYGSLERARRLVPRVVRFHERRFGRLPVHQHRDRGPAPRGRLRPGDAEPAHLRRAPGHRDVVHELAHQWYGDSVTPRDWQDIWLNEGFATYAEDLWAATHGGPRAPRSAFRAPLRGAPGRRRPVVARPPPGSATPPTCSATRSTCAAG